MWGRKKQRRGSTQKTLRHEKHIAEFADAKWKKSGSACQCFQKLYDFIDVELRSWLMLIINDWQLGQQLNISEHPSTCPTRRGFGRSSNAGACNTCNRVLRPDSAQPKWLPLVVLWQSYGFLRLGYLRALEHGKAKPLVSTCFHIQNSLYWMITWDPKRCAAHKMPTEPGWWQRDKARCQSRGATMCDLLPALHSSIMFQAAKLI